MLKQVDEADSRNKMAPQEQAGFYSHVLFYLHQGFKKEKKTVETEPRAVECDCAN